MEIKYIFIIIILVLILVIIGIIYSAVKKVQRKVRQFSREVFGTSDIRQGIKKVENEYATTPKSVSAMTSISLPQITKDFPEFNYEEMKGRARNVLLSYLMGVSQRSVEYLKDGNSELKNQLQNHINALELNNRQEYFDDPKIHRTEIAGYRKAAGRCTIVFQSSIQYKHYIMDMNGNVIKGSNSVIEQSRYNVELIYIQDRTLAENDIDGAQSLNCPNCGGPIQNMGAKKCIYCGTPVIEYNIHVWSFSAIHEL